MSGLTDKRRRFCEFLVQGLSQAEAYGKAGFKVTRGAEQNACKLLKIPKVQAYYRKLQDGAKSRSKVTTDQIVDLLGQAIMATPGDAGSNKPFCGIVYVDGQPRPMPISKLGAIDRLAKITGLYNAERVEHLVNDDIIKLMRVARKA